LFIADSFFAVVGIFPTTKLQINSHLPADFFYPVNPSIRLIKACPDFYREFRQLFRKTKNPTHVSVLSLKKIHIMSKGNFRILCRNINGIRAIWKKK
jgi:hypothetical protein